MKEEKKIFLSSTFISSFRYLPNFIVISPCFAARWAVEASVGQPLANRFFFKGHGPF